MKMDFDAYQMMVENSPSLICRTGTNGLCQYFNKTWLKFTGRTLDQEYGKGWTKAVHPEDLPVISEAATRAFSSRKPFEVTFRLRRHDGEWRWISNQEVPVFDSENVFQGYVGNCIDITEQIRADEDKCQVQLDSMTGILGRRHFLVRAGQEVERFHRFRENFSIVMIDVDDLEQINRTRGIIAGDDVLRHFGQTLSANVRKFDLVGRYGDDEFVVLFAAANLDQAGHAMKRLSKTLSKPLQLTDGSSMAVDFSYGFAIHKPGVSLEILVNSAENAMARMKTEKTKRKQRFPAQDQPRAI